MNGVAILAPISADECFFHGLVEDYAPEVNELEAPRVIHCAVERRNPAGTSKGIMRREPWVLKTACFAITDGIDGFSGHKYPAGTLICSDSEGYATRAAARTALTSVGGEA